MAIVAYAESREEGRRSAGSYMGCRSLGPKGQQPARWNLCTRIGGAPEKSELTDRCQAARPECRLCTPRNLRPLQRQRVSDVCSASSFHERHEIRQLAAGLQELKSEVAAHGQVVADCLSERVQCPPGHGCAIV